MPDPPDKLDPKATASTPKDGSAAPTHTSGAASGATPASSEARTGDAGQASSSKPKTPKNVELEAALDAAQQKIAALEASVATLELQNEHLKNPSPTTMTWMEAKMKERLSYIKEYIDKLEVHWAQTDEENRKRRLEHGKCANEQRAINAILDAVEKAKGSSRTTGFSQRDVALAVQDEALVREAAQALFVRDLADRELKQQSDRDQVDASHKRDVEKLNLEKMSRDIWYKMLEDFHYLVEQERRRELAKVGAAGPPDHRRFALADPEMVQRLKEERLAGYLECARSFDLRAALHRGVEIPDNEIAYLKTLDDPACPYQMGIAVGEMMGWRALCSSLDQPDWDHSLNPRKWVVKDFKARVHTPLEGGFWDGANHGYLQAQENFYRQCKKSMELTASDPRLGDDRGRSRKKMRRE